MLMFQMPVGAVPRGIPLYGGHGGIRMSVECVCGMSTAKAP